MQCASATSHTLPGVRSLFMTTRAACECRCVGWSLQHQAARLHRTCGNVLWTPPVGGFKVLALESSNSVHPDQNEPKSRADWCTAAHIDSPHRLDVLGWCNSIANFGRMRSVPAVLLAEWVVLVVIWMTLVAPVGQTEHIHRTLQHRSCTASGSGLGCTGVRTRMHKVVRFLVHFGLNGKFVAF